MGKFIYGAEYAELIKELKRVGAGIPAINVSSSSVINAVFEAAAKNKVPAMMQLSHGGAAFFSGPAINNDNNQGSIAGAIAAANYIHQVANLYNVDYLITTDHAQKDKLPWLDGVIEASELNYSQKGFPLFTVHMTDLSEESLQDNLQLSSEYFKRLNKIESWLEFEVGVTGGEEDGVDNSDVDHERLYTSAADIVSAYNLMSNIGQNFLVAAAFGNVHGVYAPGNVILKPEILQDAQELLGGNKQINFVFHGGSGSNKEDVQKAVAAGVVKMNVDTDVQWAYWKGVLEYYKANEDRLQMEVGTSTDPEAPNKKFFDPRKWLRKAELSVVEKIETYYDFLNTKLISKD